MCFRAINTCVGRNRFEAQITQLIMNKSPSNYDNLYVIHSMHDYMSNKNIIIAYVNAY